MYHETSSENLEVQVVKQRVCKQCVGDEHWESVDAEGKQCVSRDI